jgi:hypothetical protein
MKGSTASSTFDAELRRFLPRAYDLKAVADYEAGPDAVVLLKDAETGLQTAVRPVECVASLLRQESHG